MFLRYKLWCMDNQKRLVSTGLFLIGSYAICIIILLTNMILEQKGIFNLFPNKTVYLIVWIGSTCLPMLSIYCKYASEKSLTDLDKLWLCVNLKTKFDGCNVVINNIITAMKKNQQGIQNFTYKNINIGTILMDEYRQPYIHVYDELGYMLSDAKKYMVYSSREANTFYVIEFLHSLTTSEDDVTELEKVYFQYCC